MSLHITLAGQLAAAADGDIGHATQLNGRRASLAFAYLVAERDRPVPRGELADVVWDGALPPTWQPALRGVVSKVRRFLDALGFQATDVLTSVSGCYRLTLPADTIVDIEFAAREVGMAEGALQTSNLTRALTAAGRAREIAGRPLLPGHEGAWVEARRAALHGLLIRSLELLVDIHLADRHGGRAVGPARELVALDPFRDTAHERLLRAHAAAGDRGHALRVYDEYRRLLADELGVGPAPDVEAAYMELLHADPGAPAGQAADVMPPSTAVPAAHPFVGRSNEVDRLRTAWLDAQHGQRRAILVAGEAGIGKTRLVAEFATLAERNGATVLWGRCDQHLSVPYLPLREAFGRYLAAVPRERLRTLLGARAPELVRFWPELAWRLPTAQRVSRTDPDADQYLLFQALTVVLEAIGAAGPVLLVLDDVHGADEATLVLLRSLAHTRRPANVMILLIYRNDESIVRANRSAALGDLLRAPGTDLVSLDGLAVDDVATLVSTTVGGPLGEGGRALARVLRERTGGNPFFVGVLLRHLAETGAFQMGNLTEVAAGPAVDDAPESLRWVVAQRLTRSGSAVEQVVAATAVIGPQADMALLGRVVDLGYDDLLSALDRAVTTRFLEQRPGLPGRYAFRHALVRDLVYRSLPAVERARIHRRVGEALEDMNVGSTRLAELADHFALAGDGHVDRALDYARRAGEHAFAEHLYEEAAHRFRQAVSALDRVRTAGVDMDRRCDLLLALGAAWTAAGEINLATDAYLRAADAGRASGSAEHLARAALGLGGPAAFWSTELDRDRPVKLLQDALEALGTEGGVLSARLVARLAGWQAVSTLLAPERIGEAPRSPVRDSSNATFSDAVAMARRTGDRSTVAAVLADQEMTWSGMLRPEGPEAALAGTAELDRLAVELGDEGLAYRASLVRAGALLTVGDLDGVDRLAERERLIAEERHVPHHRWLSVTLQVTRAMVSGDFQAGEALAEDALQIGLGPLGEAATLAYGAQLVFLRWLQGRPVAVEAVIDRLIAEQRPGTHAWQRLLSLASIRDGRDADARRQLDAAMAHGLAGRSIADLVTLIGVCAHLGDGVAADQLYRLLVSWSGHHLAAGHIYLGAVDHHLAILAATAGRPTIALRHARQAQSVHRRLGARPWQALTLHVHAGILRDHGGPDDRSRAVRMAAEASAIADVLGMELHG